MTVGAGFVNKTVLTADGDTDYEWTFRIFKETDLTVLSYDDEGTKTSYTLNSDFTVLSGVNDSDGGTIRFTASGIVGHIPPVGDSVVLWGTYDFEQTKQFSRGGLISRVALEDAFDKQMIINIRQKEEIDRSPKMFAAYEGDVAELFPEAGKVVGWNETGTGFKNYTNAELAVTQAETYATNAYNSSVAAANSASDSSDYASQGLADITAYVNNGITTTSGWIATCSGYNDSALLSMTTTSGYKTTTSGYMYAAYQWSMAAEDSQYDDGVRTGYSAYHWAQKAYDVVASGTPPAFPAGTKLIFYQNTAPTGWTIDSTVADAYVCIKGGSDAWNANGGTKAGTHTQPTHTHTGPSHVHSGPSHTHTGPDHYHSGPTHTHTGGAHTHTLSSHTHAGPSHTHDMSSHTHTGPSHTHTGPDHTHAGDSHSHTVNIYHRHAIGDGAAGTQFATIAAGDGSTPVYTDYQGSSSASTSSNSGTTGSGGTGATGSAGTGATGGPSTANTGSGGTGATGGPSTADTSSAGAVATGNNTAANTGNAGTGATGSSGTADTGAAGTGATGASATAATWRGYAAICIIATKD